MTFKHLTRTSGKAEGMEADILGALSGLGNSIEPTQVKFAGSDREGGNARGVIFYTEDKIATVAPPLGSGPWEKKTYNVDDLGFEKACTKCEDKLNSLNDASKLSSTVIMTDGESLTAYLVIYYQDN